MKAMAFGFSTPCSAESGLNSRPSRSASLRMPSSPPGGEEGVKKLADLLGVEPKSLDETHGTPKPKSVAFIDEQICIGCTLCIQACPVDAIAGAAKQMHTIIASECTGCELCLPPCPVDCISMVTVAEDLPHWKWKHPLIMLKKVA